MLSMKENCRENHDSLAETTKKEIISKSAIEWKRGLIDIG